MKALPCPSCGAPITVKKGLASQKCSFCENVFQMDFANVPEFEGLDGKLYSKLKRRAFDSLKRDLFTKASLQFSALAELLSDKNNEDYFEIQALSYSVKLREVLAPAYNLTSGTTLLSMKHESTYAAVSAPQYQYVRVDAPMVDLIEEIEDKCDSLTKEDSIVLAKKSFNYLYDTLNELIIPGTNFILEGGSYTETEEYGDFGEWINRIALAEPVYVVIKIRCEMYSMLLKFLELIDIGESENNPEISLKVHQEALINCFSDIRLNHLDLNQRHPREPYNYKFILEHSEEVREALERWSNLNDKLEPYFKEQEKIKAEEERKRKIEEERIKEQKKAEVLKKAKEEKEKREEWMASPEYKAQKKRQKQFIFISFISAALVSLVFIFMSKNSSESNSRTNFNIEKNSQELLKANLRNDIEEFIKNGKCFDFEGNLDKKLIFGEELNKYVSINLNSLISSTEISRVSFDKKVWNKCFGKSKVIEKGRLEDGSKHKFKTFFFKSNNSIVKVNTSKNLIEEFSFDTK